MSKIDGQRVQMLVDELTRVWMKMHDPLGSRVCGVVLTMIMKSAERREEQSRTAPQEDAMQCNAGQFKKQRKAGRVRIGRREKPRR